MSAWERRCQDAAENQIPVPPYRTLNCWPSFFTERTFNPGIRGVGPVGLLSQKKEKRKKKKQSRNPVKDQVTRLIWPTFEVKTMIIIDSYTTVVAN